jgi:hypothetical protein
MATVNNPIAYLLCLLEFFKFRVHRFFFQIQKGKRHNVGSLVNGRRKRGRWHGMTTVQIGHVKGGRRTLYGVYVHWVHEVVHGVKQDGCVMCGRGRWSGRVG